MTLTAPPAPHVRASRTPSVAQGPPMTLMGSLTGPPVRGGGRLTGPLTGGPVREPVRVMGGVASRVRVLGRLAVTGAAAAATTIIWQIWLI